MKKLFKAVETGEVGDLSASIESVKKSKESQSRRTESEEDTHQPDGDNILGFTESQLKDFVDQGRSDLQQQLQQQQQQLEELQKKYQSAETNRKSLENVFKVQGIATPGFNRQYGLSGTPQGVFKEWEEVRDNCPVEQKYTREGRLVVQRDSTEMVSFFRAHREELRRGFESALKQNGLLGGNGRYTEASTTKPDITPAMLDYLSTYIRESHISRFVYWQFPISELDIGRLPGDTIQVGRFRYLSEPAPGDRILTPGTATTTDDQPVLFNSVSITVTENGLGLNPANAPVAVPEFYMRRSAVNLESAVQRILGYDYYAWEDAVIRQHFFASTVVYYPDANNQPTTTPTAGVMSHTFLDGAYALLAAAKTPTLVDGCYIAVLHTNAASQLRQSLYPDFQFNSSASIEDLTNALRIATGTDMARTSGYVGKVCGFHVFETNAHSLGVAGTEGAQTEASATTRTSFAFGVGAVGRGIGMPMEIRLDKDDDFGRMQRFIWIEHSGTGALDVDIAVSAEQQTRVIQLRTV